MGPKAAQTKSRTQKPLINIARLRPSADAYTAAVVGNGYESNMPGFGEMYSEDELRDVLAWIKTQWPDRERDHQVQVTAQDSQSN